jgi:hypothetical protein
MRKRESSPSVTVFCATPRATESACCRQKGELRQLRRNAVFAPTSSLMWAMCR